MKVVINTKSKIIEILEGTDFEISNELPFMVEDFSEYKVFDNTHKFSEESKPPPIGGIFQQIKDSEKIPYTTFTPSDSINAFLEALTKEKEYIMPIKRRSVGSSTWSTYVENL